MSTPFCRFFEYFQNCVSKTPPPFFPPTRYPPTSPFPPPLLRRSTPNVSKTPPPFFPRSAIPLLPRYLERPWRFLRSFASWPSVRLVTTRLYPSHLLIWRLLYRRLTPFRFLAVCLACYYALFWSHLLIWRFLYRRSTPFPPLSVSMAPPPFPPTPRYTPIAPLLPSLYAVLNAGRF